MTTINHHPTRCDATAGSIEAGKGTGIARYSGKGAIPRYVKISPQASRPILKATENWTPLGTGPDSSLSFVFCGNCRRAESAQNLQNVFQKGMLRG